jgi:sugar phosphate isomerase/epimerase
MLDRLQAVCRIAAGLGATRLVFGSPKNRDRLSLSDDEVAEVAGVFFRRLGDIAADHGVFICLEPNPARYGCNFLTGTDEAARMVRLVAHGHVRLQLDTGAIAINGEDPVLLVEQHGDLIGHVHASEPDLVPLGDGNAPHADVARALRSRTTIGLVAIEMLETKKEKPIEAIERALRTADKSYRRENDGGDVAS